MIWGDPWDSQIKQSPVNVTYESNNRNYSVEITEDETGGASEIGGQGQRQNDTEATVDEDRSPSASDVVSGAGAAAGVAEHTKTHPVWVGKNGQIKINTKNYHGNQYNGSKAAQIVKAKDLAKKIGVRLTALFALVRAVETWKEVQSLRQSGASNSDIYFEISDAGMDIAIGAVGLYNPYTFVASVAYSIADYASGGNLTEWFVSGLKSINGPSVPSQPFIPRTPVETQSFLRRLFTVPPPINMGD